jgi:hypothetical protein
LSSGRRIENAKRVVKEARRIFKRILEDTRGYVEFAKEYLPDTSEAFSVETT